jgi:hypothetical protein
MVELRTQEQALSYLQQISPGSQFRVYPFENCWVCREILTPEQTAAGMDVGLGALVIDSQTGVVTQHSSLPIDVVAENYIAARQAGRLTGFQIYPHQWKITIQRMHEDPATITYQVTAVSLNDPPEPTQEHPLTINKRTLAFEPRDTQSRVAMSHAEQTSRQQQGTWPEHITTEF